MTKLKALPLQTWLVLIVVLVSALGLSASAFAVNGIMRDFAYSNVDNKLQQASKSWLDRGEFQRPGATQQGPPSDFYVLKRFSDGTILEVNDGTDAPDVGSVRFDDRPTTVSSIGNGDHVRWRVLGFTQGQEQTIVAQSLEREDSLLRRLTIVQVFIGFIVLGILGLVAMWAVRRALRPLKEVEHTARDIAAGDLDRRVPQWPMSTEVGQLAAALNIMLTQLQDSLMTAQQKEEQMRRFVGDASHELRTPLTSVKGYTELYRSGATQDFGMVIDRIEGEAARMTLLVEDLLALTRAEGSRMEKQPVDMFELAVNVVSSVQAAHPGRSIGIHNDTTEPPMVIGDASQLHRVLSNIVVNGLKHGGPDAAVDVNIRKDGDTIVVAISDNGVGMSPEVTSHIFERFYRADESRSRESGGSGLGLAITKTLVEAHGGSISVDSVEGEGSTFRVALKAV